MKFIVLLVSSLFMTTLGAAETTKAGIELNTPWKITVYKFAQDNLQHSAWGVAHSERNYLMAKKLAQLENVKIDDDVLFAAAFLHDIGVFTPYVIEGAEHSKTATENIVNLLQPTGFPMQKIADVNASILSHMFYAQVSENDTARVFHDADTLDFLGTIGVTRIISVTTRHRWATDLTTAIATIEKFNKELPEKLVFKASKKIADARQKEAASFLQSLKAETNEALAL